MGYLNPSDLEERRPEVAELLDAGPTSASETRESPLGSFEVHKGSGLVFTAPHEMPQMRDGAIKHAESGTGNLAVALATLTGGSALATTGEQTGDPNWDEEHPFTQAAIQIASGSPLIDLHMMRPRGFEVCLGLGPDYEMSRPLWVPLLDELLAADVRVSINWPFGARGTTVTAAAQKAGSPAIQVEMIFDVFDDGSDAQVCVLSALARATRHWVR